MEGPGQHTWLPKCPILGGGSILCRVEIASRPLITSAPSAVFTPCTWATTVPDKVDNLNPKRKAWILVKFVTCACVITQIQIGNRALEERTTEKGTWLKWIWISRIDGPSIPWIYPQKSLYWWCLMKWQGISFRFSQNYPLDDAKVRLHMAVQKKEVASGEGKYSV